MPLKAYQPVSEALANMLDIGTAWRRVKSDIKTRVFIRHPYSVSLIEFDLNLPQCDPGEQIFASAMFVCDVPKGTGCEDRFAPASNDLRDFLLN